MARGSLRLARHRGARVRQARDRAVRRHVHGKPRERRRRSRRSRATPPRLPASSLRRAASTRSRVGFYGLSQGGWIIPQAAVRAGSVVSWSVIESGPTVTQGESDNYASLAATLSIAEAERQAHAAGPSGYDPQPWIRKLNIPVLWLYAGRDRAQPAGTSMQLLKTLSAGHDFTTVLFPSAPHPLFDQSGFPPELFPRVAEWLRAHQLA